MIQSGVMRGTARCASFDFFTSALFTTTNDNGATHHARPIAGRTCAGFWLSSALVQVALHSRLIIGSQHAHMILHV